MRYVFVSWILVLLSVVYISPAKACSGGAPFFIEGFEDHDIIIHATVLDVDDRGYNAILHVDRYFKGYGGEYLAVIRYSPALEVVAGIRDYDMGCTRSGGGQAWVTGSKGYFALSNNGNGTYTDEASQYYGAPHFFVQDDMVEFYSFDAHALIEIQLRSLPTDEFEALLLEYGGRDKAVSPISNAYPLMRFLTITTESGERYQLNPDRSITPIDEESAPLAISNDGSHVVFRIDDVYLGFQYLFLKINPSYEERTEAGWHIPQAGKSAVFSPDSNFVAVETETNITIFMFHNYERGGYGQSMTMQIVASADIARSTNTIAVPIVWSADSTTLAYQDEQGIWLWDIFENPEPQLVVSQDAEFALIDLSVSGRYVRYGQTGTWELLDAETGIIYARAIATPDERNLVYIQSEFPDGTPDVDRDGNRSCQVPLALNCPIYISFPSNFDGSAPDIFWYKHKQIALLGCGEEHCYVTSYPWQLAIGNTYNYEINLGIPIPPLNAFAYDITYDQPVVAVNDYTLEFGFYPNYDRDEPSDLPVDIDTVNLSSQLDSPIVHLEWGQPIFYKLNQQ